MQYLKVLAFSMAVFFHLQSHLAMCAAVPQPEGTTTLCNGDTVNSDLLGSLTLTGREPSAQMLASCEPLIQKMAARAIASRTSKEPNAAMPTVYMHCLNQWERSKEYDLAVAFLAIYIEPIRDIIFTGKALTVYEYRTAKIMYTHYDVSWSLHRTLTIADWAAYMYRRCQVGQDSLSADVHLDYGSYGSPRTYVGNRINV